MDLYMCALEHSLVPIALREKLSFTKAQAGDICRAVKQAPSVSGCVLISTCNRTELYVTAEGDPDPAGLLCAAAKTDYGPYAGAFRCKSHNEAMEHLMEVAAGLRSRIWGEDQIISQVKNAIAIAREAHCADPVLETVFRTAVSAGKEIRTQLRLTEVPASAASTALQALEARLGSLKGRKAMVIGNGEMGRLSASLLRQAGCQVTITLRTYHHGETVVPYGCSVVPYDQRFSHMEGTEILVSATTSPHYTVTKADLAGLSQGPRTLIDLAIPRDISPDAGLLPGVTLLNIDDLGDSAQSREVPPQVREIFARHMDNFRRWLRYRQCMNSRDSLKQAILQRVQLTADPSLEPEDLMVLSVDRAVELMLGGLAGQITPEALTACEQKIRAHTVPR